MDRIVLASLSPRRMELLARHHLPFRVVPARDVDEEAVRGEGSEVAATLAGMKAREVREYLSRTEGSLPRFIVGADTVVDLDGHLLGKPSGDPLGPIPLPGLSSGGAGMAAGDMLHRLSGRTHRVHTGVALLAPGQPDRIEVETAEVTFRRLTGAEIECYVRSGEPRGKAGGYAIQGQGASLIEGFRGCYYTIVGLPVKRLLRMLAEAGFPAPPAGCDCARQPLQRGTEGCR